MSDFDTYLVRAQQHYVNLIVFGSATCNWPMPSLCVIMVFIANVVRAKLPSKFSLQ